tara:strand:+ start:131 stop:805 length:675 start_codon:yes stop_codon:yes gene_type:complete
MIPQKKIDRAKDKIRKECALCDKLGCETCLGKIARIDKYASANIPMNYWNLSFKNFSGDLNFKKKIKNILKDIDAFYDNGKSLMFAGGLGTGKTYTACCILKIGITSGYTGAYTTMADIVAKILSSEVDGSKYYNYLLSKDFLVIDEFDSRWIFPSEKSEQIFGSSLEYILRTRFQNNLPTILCSNNDNVDTIFGGYFARSFKSLRSEHIDLYFVAGKDQRRVD